MKVTKRKSWKVNNTPAPALIAKIGATNLTLAGAIAEIVANSFDAAVDGQKTEINVVVKPEEVSVVDNGIGMTAEILGEAIRLAVDMSAVIERKTSAKGHFGLGMKTACASIGKFWAIYTRPIGGDAEYRVEFDLDEWERKPNSPDAWTLTIDEVSLDESSPLKGFAHGTAVLVRRLRQKNPIAGPVFVKLGEAFKGHIEQGDIIRVNKDVATPREYNFIPGSKVSFDTNCNNDSKLRIHGWIALDTQTHNDGSYGFNIYRKQQLVETWNKDWFAAHLMTSRIIGEVHMDFIDATFFKMGLQSSEEWKLVRAEMKEILKPVVAASREISRRGNVKSPTITRKVVDSMRAAVGVEPIEWKGLMNPASNGPAGDDEPSADRQSDKQLPQISDAKSLSLPDGSSVLITDIKKNLGEDHPAFEKIFDPSTSPPELQIVINIEHQLWVSSKDTDQLEMLAIADGVLRYLIEEAKCVSGEASQIRHNWIAMALAGDQA